MTTSASSADPGRGDTTTNVVLLIVCQGFQALTFGGIALFLPLIRADLQMTFSDGGMLSAASTLSYALGQVPAGYLSDRFGPKRLFFIGILGATILSLLFGFVHSFAMAMANQLVSGVFRALVFVPGLALISSWFPPDRRATAMGLYVIGGLSGNIFLSLIGPFLVNQYGWRFPFILFSALGIGAAFIFQALGREKAAAGARHRVGMQEAFRLLNHRLMWVCTALQFIRYGVFISFSFWMPSLLVADRGMTVQQAGLVVAMAAAFTGPSIALGGYVSDRLRNPPLVIGGSLAVLAGTSTLLVLTHSIPLLLLVIALHATFLQFYFGPLFLVPVEVLGQRVAGLSTGFSNLFANLGALVFAYLLGVVKDRSGSFTWGFFGISLACVIGFALSIVLARIRNRTLAEQAAVSAERLS